MRAIVVAVAFTVLSFASASQACVTALDETLRTIPANGARDVAVNAAVLIDVSLGLGGGEALPSDLATLRDASGETIAVRVARLASNKVEVRPEQPLERGVTYELEVRLPSVFEDRVVAQTMTFTTTSKPTDPEEAAFVASIQQYVFAEDVELTSCSPAERGTCVLVPDDVVTEVRYLGDGFSTDASIQHGPFTANLGVTPEDNFRCVQLRHVRTDGTYGEPVVLCADEAPSFELFDNDSLRCTARGIEHEGAINRAGAGCAVNPPSSVTYASRGGAFAIYSLAMAIFALRRRSSRALPAVGFSRAAEIAARDHRDSERSHVGGAE